MIDWKIGKILSSNTPILDWFISVGPKFALFSSLISWLGMRGMYVIRKIFSSNTYSHRRGKFVMEKILLSNFDCFFRLLIYSSPSDTEVTFKQKTSSSFRLLRWHSLQNHSQALMKRVNDRYTFKDGRFFLLDLQCNVRTKPSADHSLVKHWMKHYFTAPRKSWSITFTTALS